MICFPHAKINIGLRITEKREDGFHNIESIFYPVTDLYDSLEWIESPKLIFESSGIEIEGDTKNNTCIRAWELLHSLYDIPPVRIHLQKHIPMGAGLGGGSADAAFMLQSLQTQYNLPIPAKQLHELALSIGSDCPFFLHTKPLCGEGRGDKFSKVTVELSDYWLVIANPGIHISTADAYAQVKTQKPNTKLSELISQDISQWKHIIHNDFEQSVFPQHPKIAEIKSSMYEHGALYAAMSGSGSSVYGIFAEKPTIQVDVPIIWKGKI
ncbi:MAG: 4-(cytidine 5'-diphospho)-2-C-methyl-D-erythritol kinase [Bacteroidales bacterium]|jgi:4-diphosphocytidyl-2-C-methyl-D-erythritol kinase|nr:4-(cytidine 5'-diphospho)-2-C-methyl-D-erythritol kinase [Bacteroidales bacterium]